MPMSDVAAALIYTEHGNGTTTKHPKAPPPSTTPPPPPTTITTSATAVVPSTGSTIASMTNSSKADIIAGAGSAVTHLGNMLAPTTNMSLISMQGQKWQQFFDLDKVIKQLRAAEKIHLRGGGTSSKASGGNSSASSSETKQAPHVLQVQRLNAADMAYYDMVPKQAARDIVVCNACNGSYTKAGFNNHIALQHPNIWDTVPNKFNTTEGRANATATAAAAAAVAAAAASAAADNSQDGMRDPAELLGSPTDVLSATMSSCSNGSSSSIAAGNNMNNTHPSSSSASSSSSSRHKSSSSKSSSSSKTSSTPGRSRSKSSKNRHHSDVHHKVGSKKSSAIAAAAPAPVAAASAATVSAVTTVAIKEDASAALQPAISVFSSSSNSSCSMPPTPTLTAASSNSNELGVNYSPATNMLDEPQPSKKKLKGSSTSLAAESHHRSKPAKEKQQLAPVFEQQQQLSELDQAVSSITGHVDGMEQPQRQQHQVDLSGVAEEALPMQNTSDDNSISLTLDMLDSKFINEILNTVEADIPFDESALDTSQTQPSQQQQQQQHAQLQADQLEPNTKRLRYDDGTINADAADYAAALYQQQQHGQQVYGEEAQHGGEPTQLTAMDAMQLQQLIYQQQQMLEQDDQQQPQQQQQHQQQQQQLHQNPQQQLKQEELNAESSAQFNVYNVPSLTDDTDDPAQLTATGTDEHLMLPNIIYEITENNQVSVLDQQSQQQAIAEFLNQVGYDNVDVNVNVNVLQAPSENVNVDMDVNMDVANYLNDELNDFDFTKLETVSAEANHTKTVKLENQLPQQQSLQPQQQPQQQQQQASTNYSSNEGVLHAQPHRQLVNAKYHEDSTYYNMTFYPGPPRPLAMNTFGLVKLPNGQGATLRKNVLMTRKANNSLLSLNGSSSVVGTLARPPPPPPTANCNGNGPQLLLPRNAGQGKTIYAQKSSVIAQDRLRCNKRALYGRLGSNDTSGGVVTVKSLTDLLSSKTKSLGEREGKDKEQAEQDHEALEHEQSQQQEENNRMLSFYEKRRKLMELRPQREFAIGGNRSFMRQRPMHLPLQLHGSSHNNNNNNHNNNNNNNNNNTIGSPQQQLLKKQLLRTLSDSSNIQATAATANISGNGSSNPWKSNSSTPGSNSTGSDLMRVFV